MSHFRRLFVISISYYLSLGIWATPAFPAENSEPAKASSQKPVATGESPQRGIAPPINEDEEKNEESAIQPGGVLIEAKEISSKGATQDVSASGNVYIEYKNKVITGDKAEYNPKTGDGKVEGRVMYRDIDMQAHCDVLEFNYKSGLGKMSNSRVDFEGQYFLTGEKIERTAKDKYHLKNGTITTCKEFKPHWRIDTSDVNLTLEGYAFMKGAVFRIRNVPVLYFPYFVAPAKNKRATGFLIPSVGQSSKNGLQVSQSFFWAPAENMDATFTYGYYGKKGNKYSTEARYILSPETYGTLIAEILRESDPNKENNRDLWRVRYNHRQKLPWDVSGVARVDIESENSISREYGDDVTASTRTYTDSYLHLNKTFSHSALSLIAREQKSTQLGQEDAVGRFPEISFVNQSQRLWGSPLYGSLTSSYIAYRTETVVNNVPSPYDVDRIDIFPTFTLPFSVAPWLSLTPSVGMRYTSYSNGIDENGDELNKSFSREYYTAGMVMAGPKFFRIFNTDSKSRPKTKHLITPILSWTYVPGYDFDGDDRKKVRVLDGVDYSSPVNVVSLQLLNQVLLKRITGAESSQTIEVVRFNLSQSYNIREATRDDIPDNDKRPLSTILFDLDTKIFPWLMLNYDTTYNVYDGIWESSNLELGYRYQNTFHLALDRRVKYQGKDVEDSVWDTVYVEINMPKNLSMDYSVIYNETDGEIFNNILRMRYKADCWSFGLNWYERKVNVTTDSGATELLNETGVLFTIRLEGLGNLVDGGKPPIANRKL